MKKSILVFLSILLVCTYSVMAQGTLSPADFEKKISTLQPQLLDVRTAREYQSSHIKNALQADWLNKEQFADRTQYLDKSKPVFVYCASGGRSGEAAKWLHEKGFTDVQNLQGGLTAWKMEGRSVESVTNAAQLSVTKYAELTQTSGTVLVDFGAEWCPPCKKMEPVIKQLQTELANKFVFVKADGGNDIDVMKNEKVTAIPTFILYKNGKEIWRKQGIVELTELKKRITE